MVQMMLAKGKGLPQIRNVFAHLGASNDHASNIACDNKRARIPSIMTKPASPNHGVKLVSLRALARQFASLSAVTPRPAQQLITATKRFGMT